MFVSAIDKDDEHIARAYAMGAVDYVFKPVDPVVHATFSAPIRVLAPEHR